MNTYNGIAFDPSGMAFYVSSGVGDVPFDSTGVVNPAQSVGDNVHVFSPRRRQRSLDTDRSALLGHTSGNGLVVEPPSGPMP